MGMMGELCQYTRNYFLKDYKNPSKYIHNGTFVIRGGSIQSLPFLVDGQYFRIKGSALNDGVYKYERDAREVTLRDEVFEGQIWAMFVPSDFVSLAADIESWNSSNADVLNSPYQSESFGGYTYSKASGGSSSGPSSYSWRDQFANRLSMYRRISVL